MVEKPNGDLRICQNFIALNAITEDDPQDIPNMRDIINSTQGCKYFTVIDLKDAFYSIELEEKDKHKTAFEFDGQAYEWNSMPMGYKNSPLIMQRIMNKILTAERHNGVEVYLDDIIIYTKTKEEHEELLIKTMAKLQNIHWK